jgi:hypothetical protein
MLSVQANAKDAEKKREDAEKPANRSALDSLSTFAAVSAILCT